jgi:hypothetical protein
MLSTPVARTLDTRSGQVFTAGPHHVIWCTSSASGAFTGPVFNSEDGACKHPDLFLWDISPSSHASVIVEKMDHQEITLFVAMKGLHC